MGKSVAMFFVWLSMLSVESRLFAGDDLLNALALSELGG
jgi:hypothetical protein